MSPQASMPKVSALMGAYNYGRYIVEAIESAMRQDYPPELLELIIVDDGSTDDTALLVADCMERYPDRIKYVPQENGGATAATNRARREADGDLIALLDADDVWLPHKTRTQVELMRRRPELGLVHSQMRLIDAAGATLREDYPHRDPMPANQFARLLWENVAVQSSLIIVAELFDQIPAEAPYADWWLALRAAQFAQVECIREDLVLYRWHGANITGGVGGAKALREAQKGIAFQRWVLRNFPLSEFSEKLAPEDMTYVWTGLENQAHKGFQGLGSLFGRLATVAEADRAAARADVAESARAERAGDMQTACALLLRARACDPYDMALRDALEQAVARATEAAKLPDPLAGSEGFRVLTDASFLLADDDHLRAYGAAMASVPGATLVIDASRLEPTDAATRLQDLVERCGLGAGDELAMIAIVGELAPSQRFRVERGIHARYGAETAPEATGGPPRFTPYSLDALRALAQWHEAGALTSATL